MSGLNTKEKHKLLKKEAIKLESVRNSNRSFKSWYELKELKKKKLLLKDKLNNTKEYNGNS
jgi:hypothetical protein